MLQILLNNRKLELPEDISISYEIQNPLITTDRIPIPFTQNFSVPASPRNLMALGNPSRISANVNFENKVPGEIRHSGFIISSGVFTIEEVNDKEITLNFQGAVFPDSIKQHLQNQNLGSEPLGELEIVPGSRPGSQSISNAKAMAAFNTLMSIAARQTYPDYVAAPIKIKGGKIEIDKVDAGDGKDSGVFWDNSTFINTYRPADGVGLYDEYMLLTHRPQSRRSGRVSKIIPSFRVGFIIDKIMNQSVEKNRFNGDFQNLYLICNYAPTYQIKNSSPVWNVKSNNKVTIEFSNYMPDIPADEFISEILKIPCATMFTISGRYIIELNGDILRAPCTIDWSNRISDGYSISRKAAEDYLFSVSSESASIAEDVDIWQVDFIDQMIWDIGLRAHAEQDYDKELFYKVVSTNQVYKITPNPILSSDEVTHWSCELISQGDKPEEIQSDRTGFDMNISGSVVSTTVTEYVGANLYYVPDIFNAKSNHVMYFCPEIDISTQKPERTSQLVFGLYHGKQSTAETSGGVKFDYPLMSHTNILANGTNNGGVALTTDYLMEHYHHYFKQWVEKDKQIVKGEIRLTPLEIDRFDIREKVHFKGVDFLVKTINIPLKLHEIAPVKIELIEA